MFRDLAEFGKPTFALNTAVISAVWKVDIHDTSRRHIKQEDVELFKQLHPLRYELHVVCDGAHIQLSFLEDEHRDYESCYITLRGYVERNATAQQEMINVRPS